MGQRPFGGGDRIDLAPSRQRVARRIEAESGALHLLVNNAWAGYERLNAGEWTEWTAPFWEQPLELWDAMFDGGVRTHYVTSAICAPLLRRTAGSAIVTVSMEVGAHHSPAHGVAYSVAKAADDRLAAAMAGQLAGDGTASVAVYPGLVRSSCPSPPGMGSMSPANFLGEGGVVPGSAARVVCPPARDAAELFGSRAVPGSVGQLSDV